jgi:hypothetical protein
MNEKPVRQRRKNAKVKIMKNDNKYERGVQRKESSVITNMIKEDRKGNMIKMRVEEM